MTDQATDESRCAVCGARWTNWRARWLVTDVHGRFSLLEGPAVLTACPLCKHRILPGKATVTEESGPGA